MAKILLTGANGQLGKQLQTDFSRGFTELGMELPPMFQDAELRVEDLPELDISNSNNVWDTMDEFRPELIINCAAMTNVDGCETDPSSAMKANAIGAQNLAEAAEAYGSTLVHVSTDYVFSGKDKSPRCEWDETVPVTVYGKSKLLGEKQVLSRSGLNNAYIFRTAWLYGYEGNNFVRTIIGLMQEHGTVKVVNDQIGNPTSAADLSHAILKVVGAGAPGGIYHATCEGETSWYDFAVKIRDLWKIDATVLPCTTEEFPRPAPRPAFSSLRNLMLESTVGNDLRPWEEALTCFYENDNK